MKHKKNNSFLAIACFTVFFFTAFLFLQSRPPTKPEPLADPVSLSRLIAGETLSKPPEEHYAQFHGITMTPPAFVEFKQTSHVLGVTNPSDKRIEVDLAAHHAYAFAGNSKVFDFVVST